MRKPFEFETHPMSFPQAQYMGMVRAVCKYVTDGDTYDFFIDLGFNNYDYLTVRLRGFDTAEIFHPSNAAEKAHGLAAKDRVMMLMMDHPVLLRSFKDTETFGRYVADVAIVTQVNGKVTLTDLAELLRSEGFEKRTSYV